MLLNQRAKQAFISVNGSSANFTYENKIFDNSSNPNPTNHIVGMDNVTGAITFINCVFRNHRNSVYSMCHFSGSTDIRFLNCRFENYDGAINIKNATLTRLEITGCLFKDINDQTHDIQLANCIVSNGKINDNRFHNVSSGMRAGDSISLFDTAGTVGSYLEVKRNWLRTNLPPAAYQTSFAGAGIVVGDGDNGRAARYMTVEHNVIINRDAWGIQFVSDGGTTRDINFNYNAMYTAAQEDANGKSSGGMQFEVSVANNISMLGNAVYGVRASMPEINQNFQPDQDVYPDPLLPTSQLAKRPTWLTSTLLPTNCFA